MIYLDVLSTFIARKFTTNLSKNKTIHMAGVETMEVSEKIWLLQFG